MGKSYGHPALLVIRVVRVRNGDRQCVGKDGARLVEADPVPLSVSTLLSSIPLEADGHAAMESRGGATVKPNAIDHWPRPAPRIPGSCGRTRPGLWFSASSCSAHSEAAGFGSIPSNVPGGSCVGMPCGKPIRGVKVAREVRVRFPVLSFASVPIYVDSVESNDRHFSRLAEDVLAAHDSRGTKAPVGPSRDLSGLGRGDGKPTNAFVVGRRPRVDDLWCGGTAGGKNEECDWKAPH